jgi:pimeloyl-ACP methyl ester carboxylesterase
MEPPVILVHRAGGASIEWEPVRAILGQRRSGCVVVALDLPGRRGGEAHPRSVAALAEHVVDRVIGLDRGPAVLAGHSMGGAVCLQAALDFPGWVSGLVLVASSPDLRLARQVARAIEEGRAQADPDFEAEMLSPSHDGTARRRILDAMARVPASVLRADLEAAAGLDLRGRLGEIGVPVGIVAGRHDRLISTRKASILHRSLEGSSLRLVDGAGHMLVLEAAKVVSDEIMNVIDRVRDA